MEINVKNTYSWYSDLSRDATNIEVNVFHSMACYLITQGWGTKVLMSINFCFHVLKIYARGENQIRFTRQ